MTAQAPDEQAIVDRYQQGETGPAIALSLGCHRDRVYRVLRQAGVVLPTPAAQGRKSNAAEKRKAPAPQRRQSLCLCERCAHEDVYTLPLGKFEAECLRCGGIAWSEAMTDTFVVQRLSELIERLEAELVTP